eukprot:353758-Chlamydomonas_euryale.AAC.8
MTLNNDVQPLPSYPCSAAATGTPRRGIGRATGPASAGRDRAHVTRASQNDPRVGAPPHQRAQHCVPGARQLAARPAEAAAFQTFSLIGVGVCDEEKT